MDAQIKHVTHYGDISFKNKTRIGRIPDDFTVNSPVGICMDKYQNIWLCDTGNNRVVIFDTELENILEVITTAPKRIKKQDGQFGEERAPLLLPFHAYQHPEKKQMLLTDMGNKRVVVFNYNYKDGKYTIDSTSFGYIDDGITDYKPEEAEKSLLPFPLDDPNGVTMIKEKDEKWYIYVNDEFQYDPEDSDQINRCVKFTEQGAYVNDFRHVTDEKSGMAHDLIWPQGLASDSQGNLYIANTGRYEIVKCHYSQKNVEGTTLLHSFGNPKGVGSLNILRSVNVIDDKVFVPDQKANSISVYDLKTNKQIFITGMIPTWDHDQFEARTVSDFTFTMMENVALESPYQICKGEKEGVYFITEPFISRIIKIQIPTFEKDCKAITICVIGDRRNLIEKERTSSQFNSVTSVVGLDAKFPPSPTADPALPDYLKFNPLYYWYKGLSEAGMWSYQMWYSKVFRTFIPTNLEDIKHTKYNVDAGNWLIKAYSENVEDFQQETNVLKGYYIPGDVGMTSFYPRKPLPGQICPGTPLLFVTNFLISMVTIYQFTPAGKLVNYGTPFGYRGAFEIGGMRGPQGIEINADGEIYIADSLNHRISKWQILPTGEVVFIKTFAWEDEEYFYPTDVSIDSKNRVLVTDQFNNRIRAFDKDGNCLWSYGVKGYCNEKNIKDKFDNFMLPASLCVDDNHLVVNDLVNRFLKVFQIKDDGLEFITGKALFKNQPEDGGVWMPYLIYAHNRQIYVPDTTYNVVNVYEY
ncbi:MAG: hypothetical protein GY749_33125 [Desulfobacteraceae bacterium]|nr:hypothetical protein [Desulfobacteraceae bacterium]